MYSMPTKSRSGGLGVPHPFPLSHYQHANRLPGSVGQDHGATHDLVGVAGVDAQTDGDIHGFIELGERRRP